MFLTADMPRVKITNSSKTTNFSRLRRPCVDLCCLDAPKLIDKDNGGPFF